MQSHKWIWVLVCFVLAATAATAQPRYELCVSGERNEGNTVVYDVYMKNTGSAPINLATSDFIFQYNRDHFCDAAIIDVKLDNELRLLGYDFVVRDLTEIKNNAFGFAFVAPFVEDDISVITDRILQINKDQSRRLFQVVVSTVCNRSVPSNIRFGAARSFSTTVFSYPEFPPFRGKEFNIDEGFTICDGSDPAPEPVESNIVVFPNPVREDYNLLIKNRPFERFTIDVIDVSGRVVQSYVAETTGNSEVNDLQMPSEVPAGAYVVTVTDARDVQVGSASFMVTK